MALQKQVLTKLVKAPFIVSYKDAFISNYEHVPHLCIVMEYCEGGDLGNLIQERRRLGRFFSEMTLRTWTLQLTLALDFMHKKKILHRDLKPANVFLDKENYIRVGDLGLSKVLEFTLQQAKTQCGTPAFMAPELCQGKPYQAPADIWALGCILVQAGTFELPFKGSNFLELTRNICHAPAPMLPRRYSLELRTLCQTMLNKDPSKRPTTKEILNSPSIRVDPKDISKELLLNAVTQEFTEQYLLQINAAPTKRNKHLLKENLQLWQCEIVATWNAARQSTKLYKLLQRISVNLQAAEDAKVDEFPLGGSQPERHSCLLADNGGATQVHTWFEPKFAVSVVLPLTTLVCKDGIEFCLRSHYRRIFRNRWRLWWLTDRINALFAQLFDSSYYLARC
eukprot:XP_028344268.1 serine/threonine-protein kinase Nek11-like [Physeter catodon]